MLRRNASVRKLAQESPEAAEILDWYGLSPSDRSLDEACRAADIDPDDVWAEIEAATDELDDEDDDDW